VILIPIILKLIFDFIKRNITIRERIVPLIESKVVGLRKVPEKTPPKIVLLKATIKADLKPS
jgi:hypothetical protein